MFQPLAVLLSWFSFWTANNLICIATIKVNIAVFIQYFNPSNPKSLVSSEIGLCEITANINSQQQTFTWLLEITQQSYEMTV